MGSNKLNISNQILQSVDILVNKRISQLDFDKTIQATVLECIDAGIGKYKLSYQNSIIYAYSDNILQIYPDNTEVYVSIPQNDLDSEHKLITGLVQKDGSIAVGAIKEQDSYYPIGTDLIFDEGEFGLCSYKSPDSIILYSADGNHSLINVDDKSAEIYFKDHNYMMFGAEFRTALDEVQRETTGNYGFKIIMQFCKNSYNRKDNEPVPESEIVAREYDFSSLSIPGQSNKLVVPRKASLIREVDGNNFIRIREISIYCKGYQQDLVGEHPNDIFISNFQLFSMQPLTEAQKNANTLKIIIDESQHKKGYFDLDNNNVFLKAILKSKTKTVKDTEKVKFYWYLKNNKITSDSPQYNTWGGANWECLNSFEEDENGKRLWAPSGETFELINTFNNNIYKFPSPINIIRCVALLGRDDNQERLVDEIAVRNEYNNYRVEITSTNGQDFYFDKGQTTLQAKLIYIDPKNGKESNITENNKCIWGYKDVSNVYYQLGFDQDHPYEWDINDISHIISYRIYSCAFYTNDDVYLGQSTIKISNIYQNQQQDYNLVLKNGNKVYKYDMNGVSPAAAYIPNPIAIDPVTFSLFDKQGTEISFEQIQSAGGTIEWRYPVTDTMIKVAYSQSDTYEDPNDSNYRILTGTRSFQYSIKDTYEYSKGNNNITLTIKYKDSFCPAYATFAFIKDGALGTNGTAYYCSITPVDKAKKQISIIKKGNNTPYIDAGNTSVVLDNGATINAALLAQLIKNGDASHPVVKAYNGQSENGVRWYIPEMNQGDSAFTVAENGTITINESQDLTQTTNNIVRVEIDYDSYKHFTEYSIPVVILPQNSGQLMLSIENGFSYVQYQSDGRNPKYNHAPFRAVLKNGNTEIVDDVEYKWQIMTYRTLKATSSDEQRTFSCEPLDVYNNIDSNAAIKLTVKYDDKIYILIHSIQYYLDRYGKGYINDWDGNSVKIDNNNNYILAPQIGAGKLGTDHSFTGITMGMSFEKKEGSDDVQIGLMGYAGGARSIFLDAKTGAASFGVSGQGQIILEPGKQAIIRSGNYEDKDGGFRYTYLLYLDLRPMLDNNGKPVIKNGKQVYETYEDPLTHHTAVRSYKITDYQQYVTRTFYNPDGTSYTREVPMPNGIGMSINLTEPSIKAGAGQFQITKNGKIITKSGQIAGWHLLKGLPFNENNLVDTNGINIGNEHIEKQDRNDYPTVTVRSIQPEVAAKQIKILSSEDDVNKDPERKYGTTLQSDGSLYCRKLVARDSGVIGGWNIGTPNNISTIFYSSTKEYDYSEDHRVNIQAGASLLTSQKIGSTAGFVCLDPTQGIYQLRPKPGSSSEQYVADWALLDDGTCIFKKGYIAGWEINQEYLLAQTKYTDKDYQKDGVEKLQTIFNPQKNTVAAKNAFLKKYSTKWKTIKDIKEECEDSTIKAKNISMSYVVSASLIGEREIELNKDGSFTNKIDQKLQEEKGQLIVTVTSNDGKSTRYLYDQNDKYKTSDQYVNNGVTTLWQLTRKGGAFFKILDADTGHLGGSRGIEITKEKTYGALVAGNGDTVLKGTGSLVTNKLYASGGQIANWTIDDDGLVNGTLIGNPEQAGHPGIKIEGLLNGSQVMDYNADKPGEHQFGLDKIKITDMLVMGSQACIISSSEKAVDGEGKPLHCEIQLDDDEGINIVTPLYDKSKFTVNGNPVGGVDMITASFTLSESDWDVDDTYTVYISDIDEKNLTNIGSLRPSDVVFYYPQPLSFENYVSNRIYIISQLSDSLVFKRMAHTVTADIDVCIAVFKS